MTAIRVKWLAMQFVALLCGWMVGGAWGFVVCVALFILIDIRVAVEEINRRGDKP